MEPYAALQSTVKRKDPKIAQNSLQESLKIAPYIPFKGNIRALYSLQKKFKETTGNKGKKEKQLKNY